MSLEFNLPTIAHQEILLLAETKPCYQLPIALHIIITEVRQETAPLTYQLQETSPGVVVVFVRLEVFGHLIYPLGEKGDLNLS
jgi:hypothetical protein